MPYGESQEHEAPPTIELGDLPWNTHDTLREHFGHPTNPEFFGEWLVWFYDALNQQQRRTLRKTHLSNINQADFPAIPTHKESS